MMVPLSVNLPCTVALAASDPATGDAGVVPIVWGATAPRMLPVVGSVSMVEEVRRAVVPRLKGRLVESEDLLFGSLSVPVSPASCN
jgi:hypothetical protein